MNAKRDRIYALIDAHIEAERGFSEVLATLSAIEDQLKDLPSAGQDMHPLMVEYKGREDRAKRAASRALRKVCDTEPQTLEGFAMLMTYLRPYLNRGLSPGEYRDGRSDNLFAGTHRDPLTSELVFKWLPTVPELRQPKRKPRPTPDNVAADIMAIMPAHVVDAMMLTAMFGFRGGEVFPLKRTHIDWDAGGIRLLAEEVKDDEDAFLPGSQFAMGYLWCLDMEAEVRGTHFLITWRAGKDNPYKPITKPRGAWRRAQALMRAKYGRTWRWHDLRAAFITHVAIGSGGVIAQTMARHSDPQTTHAYIEVADEMRRLAADRIGGRAMQIAANESCLQDLLTQKFAAAQGRRKPLK